VRPIGGRSADDQEIVERDRVGARDDLASPNSPSPALDREAEAVPAGVHREALFVNRALDRAPVIATGEPPVGTPAEPTRVVRDRRSAQPQLPTDLRLGHALRQTCLNLITSCQPKLTVPARPGDKVAADDRLVPGPVREAKPLSALVDCVALVVVRLDEAPVRDREAAAGIRVAEYPGVPRNGARADPSSTAILVRGVPSARSLAIRSLIRTYVRIWVGRNQAPIAGSPRTARDGFEPPLRGPEPRVLPLDDRARSVKKIAAQSPTGPPTRARCRRRRASRAAPTRRPRSRSASWRGRGPRSGQPRGRPGPPRPSDTRR
jgi:hypothetical protein